MKLALWNVRPAWFVALIASVGLVALLAVMAPDGGPTPAPDRPDESATDSEIAQFFDSVGAVASRRDGAGAADLFDPDRLYREATAALPVPRPDPRGPARVLDAVWDGFASGWLGSGWSETRLRRIDRLPGGAEVVVLARHRTPAGVVPARWWLVRRDGRWRAYDLEDIRVGLRLSHQLTAVAAVQVGEQDHAELGSALKAMTAASAELAAGDAAGAARALEPARAARLPAPHRAILCLTEAAVALELNDPEAALNWADQADRARPGIPGTGLVRAVAYHRQHKWAAAAAAATPYVEALGPDTRASLVLGLSLLELGRRAEAVEVLRAAAAEDPGHAGLSDALRRGTDPR